jgi:hypothetical protein
MNSAIDTARHDSIPHSVRRAAGAFGRFHLHTGRNTTATIAVCGVTDCGHLWTSGVSGIGDVTQIDRARVDAFREVENGLVGAGGDVESALIAAGENQTAAVEPDVVERLDVVRISRHGIFQMRK